MNIHPLIPEDYPVIDSYMQELHDLHVQGRPDLFIPASHIYSEADFREITTDGNHIALAMTDDHFIAGFIIAALRTKSNMVTGTLIAYVDDMFVLTVVRKSQRLFFMKWNKKQKNSEPQESI